MATIQLDFNLPAYAKDMLWLTDGADYAELWQDKPKPEVPDHLARLELRWGTPQGSLLAEWAAPRENLKWACHVKVNGHIETVHLLESENLEVMVFELTGQLLPQSAKQLPTLTDLKTAPHEVLSILEIPEKQDWYAFIVPLESGMADFAHQALVNGYAVDCYGALANQKSRLYEVVGLPLVLETMTLYSSR